MARIAYAIIPLRIPLREWRDYMGKKKRLQELTLKNNFMFGAVMADEEICKHFLEMVLGFPIERVEVSKERSIIYHPEYKGVRLDIYAKDENHTHYNVEMQVNKDSALPRRSRYYHSQIDMELLLSGTDYSELPDTYVIFICDYDPYGKKKYVYTFESHCKEDEHIVLGDGVHTIYLSTCGENKDEVPKELVKFLEYVKADLYESTADFEDDFVSKLQRTVRHIKSSREMEERYMLFEELLKSERKEGKIEERIETIMELLADLGPLPEALKERLENETDMSRLKAWFKLAAKAESIEQFEKEIQ